jgi:hypothetical protein
MKYENDQFEEGIRIERLRGQPCTYFDSYTSRLRALAVERNMEPTALKALIEAAFGKADAPPREQETRIAMMKLAKLKVGPCELRWLLEYDIVNYRGFSHDETNRPDWSPIRILESPQTRRR